MHLYFKLHILRAVAGSAGAITGALVGILVASRNRSAAQFESSARHSVRESMLQIRDGASEAVLKLLGSPVFEEWSGRISKLAQRIAATAEPDEPSIAGSGDADDLRMVEVAIERLSTDNGAQSLALRQAARRTPPDLE
jgi:Ni,Fe-hydrogenase III large subunit